MKSDYFAALMYASGTHLGQTYDNKPFIVHPIEVSDVVTLHTKDDMAMVVAILHDIIEDTDRSYDDLADMFGPEIADAVLIVTRNKDKETYKEYICRVKESRNELAMAVKKADLECNLKHSGWLDAEKASSLIKRWAWALTELNKEA